jgi:hypothetical protein
MGEALSAAERERLRGFFSEALLDAVRVARVERIEPALPRWVLRRLPASADISRVAGMAFGDAVVLVREQEGRRAGALLFHELVHCAQYGAMGVRRFLRAYLRGWADAGFDYFAIPLEVQAYSMQERFERGEAFSVEGELGACVR